MFVDVTNVHLGQSVADADGRQGMPAGAAASLGIVPGRPYIADARINVAGDVIRPARPVSLSAGGQGFLDWQTSFPALDVRESLLCRSPEGCDQRRDGEASYCEKHKRLFYTVVRAVTLEPHARNRGRPMHVGEKKSARLAQAMGQ